MAVPAWLQTLRSLRPTHVVGALPRGSPLLLLTPRDLRRADDAPIPRIELPAAFLASAVLRAARDAGALLVLQKPGAEQGEGMPPAHFAAAVIHAADELGFALPFALSTAPLPVGSGEGGADHLRADIQRYLDAGFSEITLAAPVVDEDTAQVLREALVMVREREVPLAVAGTEPRDLAPMLAELRGAGFAPELLRVRNVDESAQALPPAMGLELPLSANRTDLRGVDLTAPIRALVEARLGDRLDPAAWRELEAADEATRLKLEALTYGEALRLLRADAFRGAAARAMRALAGTVEG